MMLPTAPAGAKASATLGPDARAEPHPVLRRAEDVGVEELPPSGIPVCFPKQNSFLAIPDRAPEFGRLGSDLLSIL